MKIYLAAPWVRREEAKAAAAQAVEAGHTITHDWWNHEAGNEDTDELERLGRLDYDAVRTCEAFIVLNLEKSEGKSVEQGIALYGHLDGPAGPYYLIGVGPRGTNIFQNLACWLWVDTF